MIYFIFAVIAILIDRGVKLWIVSTLEVGQALEFIPGILRINHVENTGAAFSILSNMRWPLVVVSSVAVIVLIFVILLYRDGELGRLGASFILGGAVGNLIDRVAAGKVVDMFEPEFINFAVFNVADIFVTVGCMIFIVHLIYLMVKQRGQKEADAPVEKLAETQSVQRVQNMRETAAAEPRRDGAPTDEQVLTEQQILMEYYMEQGIDDRDV